MIWSEYFYYSDGQLFNKITRGSRALKDTPVGSVANNHYLQCSIRGSGYLIHRIIWELHHGVIPNGKSVDHINGDRLDNRVENLRLADRTEQQCNRGIRKDSSTGHKGVSLVRKTGKFMGEIRLRGRRYKTQQFTSVEDAAQATRALREQLHKEFARHE